MEIHLWQHRVVFERRRALPSGLRLSHPQLDALHLTPVVPGVFLGVGNAGAGGHEVQLAGPDHLLGTQAVVVLDLSGHQPGHRLQADVGMGADGHTGVVGD